MGCTHSSPQDIALYAAVEKGKVQNINRVLKKVASADMRKAMLEWEDLHGRTPLVLSIAKHDEEAAVTLMKHGAEVNDVNPRQGTVLLAALKAENLRLVNILLERGACPFLKYANGMSAWDYVLQNSCKGAILREFERHSLVCGPLRFQVPVIKREPNGWTTLVYTWQKLWVSVVPEHSIKEGHVVTRRFLYVFNHPTSRSPMCIAELGGARGKIVSEDKGGTTATVVLTIPPLKLEGFASIITTSCATFSVRQSVQDEKFLMKLLSIVGSG